jgi:serine/threonine protein kinase
VTLYELLTGVRPFDSLSHSGVIAAHLRGEPIPASELQPAIYPEINDLVMRAIARRPCDRFQTALEFRDAILAADRAICWQVTGSDRPN